jgi:hypothetical protein
LQKFWIFATPLDDLRLENKTATAEIDNGMATLGRAW